MRSGEVVARGEEQGKKLERFSLRQEARACGSLGSNEKKMA